MTQVQRFGRLGLQYLASTIDFIIGILNCATVLMRYNVNHNCGCVCFSSGRSIKQCWNGSKWCSVPSGSNWRSYETCCRTRETGLISVKMSIIVDLAFTLCTAFYAVTINSRFLQFVVACIVIKYVMKANNQSNGNGQILTPRLQYYWTVNGFHRNL